MTHLKSINSKKYVVAGFDPIMPLQTEVCGYHSETRLEPSQFCTI